MNPYVAIASIVGTSEALSLSDRLASWHDAMVGHERRLRLSPASDECHEECPHAEARTLWSDAVALFGPRAKNLTFLRTRAMREADR